MGQGWKRLPGVLPGVALFPEGMAAAGIHLWAGLQFVCGVKAELFLQGHLNCPGQSQGQLVLSWDFI